MELIRDEQRERVCEFKERGFPISAIEKDPIYLMGWCVRHLEEGLGNEISRSRWQYTMNLCQQVLNGRE
jgi:hypothetical protein